jgi:hypothetical protein
MGFSDPKLWSLIIFVVAISAVGLSTKSGPTQYQRCVVEAPEWVKC